MIAPAGFVVDRELEISPELYVGDYFADTLHLSAVEHRVLGRLLLQIWLERLTLTDNTQLSAAAMLAMPVWLNLKPVIFPLVVSAAPRIRQMIIQLKALKGQRLPPFVWQSVRRIVLLRDEHECRYCGMSQDLHVDHAIPLSRGGSNGFENLITACRSCNLSKGPKTLEEWQRCLFDKGLQQMNSLLASVQGQKH